MQEDPFQNSKNAPPKYLQFLIISISLNVGLLSALIYLAIQRQSTTAMVKTLNEVQVVQSDTNAEAVKKLFELNFHDLIVLLNDSTLLEEGYRKRDLALACLVTYYDFDIQRALSGNPFQTRKMHFAHSDGGEQFELLVFPGLTDDYYEVIIAFAKKEKWPLTPQGLYQEMQRKRPNIPEDLIKAFFATSEGYALTRLMQLESQEEKIALLLDGKWVMLKSYLSQLFESPENADHLRHALFRELTNKGSKIASSYLIQHELDFVLQRFDDHEIKNMIALIEIKNMPVMDFLKKLMVSIRSDEVQIAAGKKLYALEGKLIPNPWNQKEAIAQFLPKYVPVSQSVSSKHRGVYKNKEKNLTIHVVRSGESLWKIAKLYNKSIDAIAKENNINKSAVLPIDMELKIPY